MDFDDTPEEAAFRAEARAWLERHATPKSGNDALGRFLRGVDEDVHVRKCREWQRTLYDGGWAGVTWPKEYGGRGGTPIQGAIFNQEQAKFDVSTGAFAVGIGMVGPTLIAHGTDAQKQRYLDPMLRGDEIWCQLFSEPGAGSDLAGLQTKAIRDGGEWVVNGQKVWNSGAHYSDWGILLARTSADKPKHDGITYFVVDMRTPGIDVRPLTQINGAAHFNEVFLTDVRIPVENVIGEIDGGWGVARTTLANERTLIGGISSIGTADIARLARECGRTADPVIRQGIADVHIHYEVLRYLGFRTFTALSQGRMPGPEASVMKLAVSAQQSRVGDLVMAIEGASGMLIDDDAPARGVWQQAFLTQWSSKIGGGTDQIQRNVMGERVLGLPREPKA
ncbi:MAG TPA: acyl-CoA dehydrogenase family protein [Acidimicrobiales bacterium]|jgi:alkylation response protein AidB-like acyl-CoA dehydrogenase|nr:acyl-CoA dehydrogenase family protein [Acidimicrobiales bacterium]